MHNRQQYVEIEIPNTKSTTETITTGVGETGASCYNFHSNSIFHKNMQARDYFLTWSCNITSLLSQNTWHFILHHVIKKLSEISHEPSTVTTSPIYGVSCYSMQGKVLQRNGLPLFVMRTRILCQVVMYLVVDFQYGFGNTLGQIIIN